MALDSSPPRYVIGPDPPSNRRRIRKSEPAQVLPPDLAGKSASVFSILLGTGILASLMVAGVVVWNLKLERERRADETKRADFNAKMIDTLSARMLSMAAEHERVQEARGQLVHQVEIARDQIKGASEQTSAWVKAHQVAEAETYRIAYLWRDHSTKVEQNLGLVRSEYLDIKNKLEAERTESERNAASLGEQIRQLDQEADGYRNLAKRLDSEAAGLRSCIASLESTNSSLRNENNCLSRQVSSLESEVSRLRCQSHTCSRCGHH